MTDARTALRNRLLDAIRCTAFDSAALADELFDVLVVAGKHVLGRPTAEVELLFADLRFDFERRINIATRGMVNPTEMIDDIVTELTGSRD